MLAIAKRLGIVTFCVVVAVSVVLPGETGVEARGPYGAYYCSETGKVFWFVHASDLHVGTSGTTDSVNLRWLVTTARSVIKPLFTVVTGDLTDSTNGNIFGYPNGPYQAEWTEYKGIVTAAGVTTEDYYDLPGNHDAYNDKDFLYYKANAIQGQVYASKGQVAWTKTLGGIGTYHFVGVNTADNTGAPFSIVSPYGDHAGLDSTELSALSSDLDANAAAANLTFAFGHHPVTPTGNSQDTYLYYGAHEFLTALNGWGVLGYDYGHAHDNVETFFAGSGYTGGVDPGIRYSRVASLGKDSPKSIAVVSVDCDGVNSVFQPVATWPVVLITAPVDRRVGGASGALNPYAYKVPASSTNPIRALVFDTAAPSRVQFRIDGGTTWTLMTAVVQGGPQWVGTWNASGVAAGEHSIEVQALGSTTRSHTIRVLVDAPAVNHAPTAANDAYSTPINKASVVPAPGVLGNDSDPDGNALTIASYTQPPSGTVVWSAGGGFTYTPASNATAGTVTFTYTVSDGLLTSNVATVAITLVATDLVTITTATYTKKTGTLLVQATSSAAPSATLTVTGYGTMTYNSKTKVYSLQKKVTPAPSGVTVTSSAGGTNYKLVTTR